MFIHSLPSTVSFTSLQLVCGAPLWNALQVMQSYFLCINVDLSCQTLRRPRVVRQNAEDYVSVKSLLRFSYFPVITSMIQLRGCIPQSGQARQGEQ